MQLYWNHTSAWVYYNLHIFRIPFLKNIAGQMLLDFADQLTRLRYFHIFFSVVPANIYLFKVNNRNTRKSCEICSQLPIKTPERHWRRSGLFIVNFDHTSHLFPVFLLLTLSKKMLLAVWVTILFWAAKYKHILFLLKQNVECELENPTVSWSLLDSIFHLSYSQSMRITFYIMFYINNLYTYWTRQHFWSTTISSLWLITYALLKQTQVLQIPSQAAGKLKKDIH